MPWWSPTHWLPPNGASHGSLLDTHLKQSIAAMLLLLLLFHVFLFWSLLRRKAKRDEHPRAQGYLRYANGLLLFLSIAIFAGLAVRGENIWAMNRFQGASAEALQVEVVGAQFQWYFRYPGADARYGQVEERLIAPAEGNPLGLDPKDPFAKDDIVASELVLPVGRQINLRVRSLDVIHGFFIPGMRLKQDAVPGSVFYAHFTPIAVGEYPILCSQVCGTGHYRMQAQLRIVSQAEFARWLAAKSVNAKSAAAQTGAQ